jgi:allantoinase
MRTRYWNLRIVGHGDDTHPAELIVEDGRIAAVLAAGTETATGDEEWVDLHGGLVLPGVIDLGVRVTHPQRESLASATAAAAAGGVTCLLRLPSDESAMVDDRAGIERDVRAAETDARVDMVLATHPPHGPDWRRRLETRQRAGAGLMEVVPRARDIDGRGLRELLAGAATLDLPVVARPRPVDLVQALDERARNGVGDPLVRWAGARPAALEATAATRLVEACRSTRSRVHVHAVSCAEALDVLSAARLEGLPLTTATCPHYLEYTLDDLVDRGSDLLTDPVLRSAEDRERLWQGVASGEVDAVASDHDPSRWPEERSTGSPWQDRPGLSGVELLLPLLITAARRDRRLTLERLVRLTSFVPATTLGLSHRKGRLAPGLDADFTVVAEDEEWTVHAATLHGLQRTTPFEGRRLVGRVRATYLRGRCVFRLDPDGTETIGATGTGRLLVPRFR